MAIDTRRATGASTLERARGRLQAGRPGEAEALLRDWVRHHPGHAEGRHLLGLALVQTGRTAEGLEALRRSVALDPGEPMFPRNLGLVLAEHGALEEARTILEGLVARWPNDAGGHDILGTVHQRAGAYGAAVAAHERALGLAPGADGAWSNYAAALLGAGRLDAALQAARHALALNPGNALAALNLGNALRDGGDLTGATAAYRSAVANAPALASAWHNLGAVLRDAGDGMRAAECFAAAMQAAPAEAAHFAGFADAVGGAGFVSLPAHLVPAALACLRREDVDPQGLAGALFRALAEDPAVGLAFAHLAERGVEADLAVLADERLLGLLERGLVADERAERMLTMLRRSCLDRLSGAEASRPSLALACAIAQQAFLGEYLWPTEAGELDRVEACRADLTGRTALADGDDFLRVALLAAYRPIADLPLPPLAPTATMPDPLRRLWRDQVEAVRVERAAAAQVPVLTPIHDPVSAAVRAQYEENPYPRWRAAPALAGALPLAQKLRALFPWLGQDASLPESPRVLIAGCGTGLHPITTARLHPTARILAVDISRSSLGYAVRRARELGVAHVEFAQADLLELGGIAERFDVVECAGVLHHLAEPIAGWRVLAGLLAPGGFMKVALYSALARRGVVAARELIAAHGFAADANGIRGARAAILQLLAEEPARAVVSSPDFWSMSGGRDLLFHVQEHRFTLPQVGEALETLGLEFLGFEFPARAPLVQYQRETPEDPHGRSLSGWNDFEARHPDTFAGMYQFWVRPKMARCESGRALQA